MSMHNLIEYSNNYSKASRSLWQYYRDEPALNDADATLNFPGNKSSFKFKQKNQVQQDIMVQKMLK